MILSRAFRPLGNQLGGNATVCVVVLGRAGAAGGFGAAHACRALNQLCNLQMLLWRMSVSHGLIKPPDFNTRTVTRSPHVQLSLHRNSFLGPELRFLWREADELKF